MGQTNSAILVEAVEDAFDWPYRRPDQQNVSKVNGRQDSPPHLLFGPERGQAPEVGINVFMSTAGHMMKFIVA